MRPNASSVLFCVSVQFLCLLLFGAQTASAQITAQTGAVRVVVLDPNGSSISGAKVVLTSPVAGSVIKETTEDGSIVFALVTPGTYKVEVEQPNFKRTALSGVQVNVTEITNLRVVLELGSVVTEVAVSADVAQTVNTTNAVLGNVLTGDVLHNLPLSTRNFADLLALNAGASSTLPDATRAGHGAPVVFVAGQRGTNNNLVINGTDANNLGNNNLGNVPIPSPDSLEELRVQTSLYDASQGKTSGGNINVITRSGTNVFHGEAYEFFRNEDLNANLFFLNKNGKPRPILKQNQFGGNFGGPVPVLHDTFFFVTYEGTRQRNAVANAVTAQFPVLPATRDQASIESAFKLPAGSLNPVALKLLNLPGQYGGFLVPSGVGTPGSFGLATATNALRFSEDQFNANVDRVIGTRHRISEKFFFANLNTFDPQGGEGLGIGFGSGQSTPVTNRLATLSWTYTVSSNLVNEARFGYNRITQVTAATDPATTSQLGMTRFNSSVFPGIPLFATVDIAPAFGGISTNNDQASVANTFHFADTVAYTRGRHTFRGGFEYRRYQINLFNNFASRGFLLFNTFRDLLQGNILQAFVGTGITDRGFRARDASSYFQDDWKVTKRLTLNLGVRYDYLGPSTDVKDRLGNFDPSRLDAATLANGGPGLLNGFILPASASFGSIKGTPGVDRSTLLTNSPHDFAPRVGFAWDVRGDGKTAIRGGYGIYYVRISNQTLLQLITASPFFQQSSVINPLTPLSNPFPNLPLPSQFPVFPTPPRFNGFNAAGTPLFSGPLLALNPFDRHLGIPYVGSWNFSVQRELPAHFNVELGYIGTQGVKLLQGLQLNQAHLANAANPIVVGGANGVPQTTITTNSARDNNARVGVLGFSSTGLNTVTGNGHSTFNAFVFTVNRRTARMFIQSAYTFSKSLDNNSGNLTGTQDLGSSGGNQLDTTPLKALSNFDRPHRLQVSYQYNIPGFTTGALSHALGHWSVGGLTTFQSGLPSTITCSACANNLFGQSTSVLFPQVVGNLNQLLLPGNPGQFTDQVPGTTGVFNTSVLGVTPTYGPSAPGNGTKAVSGLNTLGGPGNQTFTIGGQGTAAPLGSFFGNLGRNTGQARAPREQLWDFYVTKSFPFREKYSFQFRSEFFNLFNHTNYLLSNLNFNGVNSVNNPTPFGVYDTQAGSSRVIQFALKFQF
jgi:Carboxypeptidase regulatory-like domain